MGISVGTFSGIILPAVFVLPMLVLFAVMISRAIMHPVALHSQNTHSVRIVFSPRPSTIHKQEDKPYLYDFWLSPRTQRAETQWQTILPLSATPLIPNKRAAMPSVAEEISHKQPYSASMARRTSMRRSASTIPLSPTPAASDHEDLDTNLPLLSDELVIAVIVNLPRPRPVQLVLGSSAANILPPPADICIGVARIPILS